MISVKKMRKHFHFLIFSMKVPKTFGREISYLRSPMTKQCIKILIKANPMNESVLP